MQTQFQSFPSTEKSLLWFCAYKYSCLLSSICTRLFNSNILTVTWFKWTVVWFDIYHWLVKESFHLTLPTIEMNWIIIPLNCSCCTNKPGSALVRLLHDCILSHSCFVQKGRPLACDYSRMINIDRIETSARCFKKKTIVLIRTALWKRQFVRLVLRVFGRYLAFLKTCLKVVKSLIRQHDW